MNRKVNILENIRSEVLKAEKEQREVQFTQNTTKNKTIYTITIRKKKEQHQKPINERPGSIDPLEAALKKSYKENGYD